MSGLRRGRRWPSPPCSPPADAPFRRTRRYGGPAQPPRRRRERAPPARPRRSTRCAGASLEHRVVEHDLGVVAGLFEPGIHFLVGALAGDRLLDPVAIVFEGDGLAGGGGGRRRLTHLTE